MRKWLPTLLCLATLASLAGSGFSQEIKIKNAKSWELSGRVQLQYLYNSDTDGNAAKTNNGFRIRRGRLQAKAHLTSRVQTKFQIEVRDNTPRLKDAEGKIRLGSSFFVRFGQFKVPVWREEMRSSGKLLLVERSAAASFLQGLNLSARQVGVEFGGKYASGVSWAANFSNGAGEGGREDAGRKKDGEFVNNGKLVSGRINFPVGKRFQLGLSAAANRLGGNTGTSDNTGTAYAAAPDFAYRQGLAGGKLEIEGGMAFGNVSSAFLGSASDQKFVLSDVTGRWTRKLTHASEALGGLDAIEFAAGVSYVEPNSDVSDDETLFLRFGPALLFGKNARLQLNGELENPTAKGAGSIFKARLQTTFNF